MSQERFGRSGMFAYVFGVYVMFHLKVMSHLANGNQELVDLIPSVKYLGVILEDYVICLSWRSLWLKRKSTVA